MTKRGEGAGNTLFVEVTSPYVIPKQAAGEYQQIVRALDRAGNSTEGTVDFQVVAGGVPFYARVPLLKNPAVANTVIVLLSILAVGSIAWFIIRRFRIRATFQHDLLSLERDARKKTRSLERELQELHQAEEFFHQELSSSPPTNRPPPAPPPAPSQPPSSPPHPRPQ